MSKKLKVFRPFLVLIFCSILCSSCTLSTRIHTIARQDAADAVSNATLADDPAAIQCFAAKLVMSEKAAQLKVSGAMSAVAAKRALRKWSEEVQRDCATVIVDGMAWIRRWVPGGL